MPTKTDLRPAATSGAFVPTWTQLAALDQSALRAAAGTLMTAPLPPVNTSLVSPAGFDAFEDDEPGGPARPIVELRTTPSGTLRIYDGRTRITAFDRPPVMSTAQLAALRPYAGVRVPFGAGTGPVELAAVLRQLLVGGVPIIAPDLPLAVRRLLGRELGDLVTAVTPATLADPDRRERWSVSARRLALRCATAAAGVPSSPPAVTAVVEPGEPALLRDLRHQTWPRLTVRIAAADDDTVAERALAGLDAQVVRGATRDAARLLALQSCQTELATVATDRLRYAPEHVEDLVLGRGYSQRPVSGVRVRRTFLRPLDLTVRAPGEPAERPAGQLTAGTVLGSPADLLSLGSDGSANGDGSVDVGDDGYAIHDRNVHRTVQHGAGLDAALRSGGRQLPGAPWGTGTVDPAYRSYFSRVTS